MEKRYDDDRAIEQLDNADFTSDAKYVHSSDIQASNSQLAQTQSMSKTPSQNVLNHEAEAPYSFHQIIKHYILSMNQDIEDEDQTDTCSIGEESLWTDCTSIQSGEDVVVQQLPCGASADYVVEATATNSCHLHVAPEAAANSYPPQIAPEAAAESNYPPQVAPEAAAAVNRYPHQITPETVAKNNYPPQIAPEEADANSYPPQIAPKAAAESNYPPQVAPDAKYVHSSDIQAPNSQLVQTQSVSNNPSQNVLNHEPVATYSFHHIIKNYTQYRSQYIEDEDQTNTCSTGEDSDWTDCSSIQSEEDVVVQQLLHGASADNIIEATATKSCQLHAAPEAAAAAANSYPSQIAPEAAAESNYPPQIAPEAEAANSYRPQMAPEAPAESNYLPLIAPEEAVANSYPRQISPEAAAESNYPPQIAPEAAVNSYPHQITLQAKPSEEVKSRLRGKRNKRVTEKYEHTEKYRRSREKNNEASKRCKLRIKEEERNRKQLPLLIEERDKLMKEQRIQIEYIEDLESKLKEKKEYISRLRKWPKTNTTNSTDAESNYPPQIAIEEAVANSYPPQIAPEAAAESNYPPQIAPDAKYVHSSDIQAPNSQLVQTQSMSNNPSQNVLNHEAVALYHAYEPLHQIIEPGAYSHQDIEDEDQTDTCSTGEKSLWTDCASVQSGEDVVEQATVCHVVRCMVCRMPYLALRDHYIVEATATNSCHLHVAPEATAAAAANSYPPQIVPEAAAESNYPPQIAAEAAVVNNYPPWIAPESGSNRNKFYLKPGLPRVPKAKPSKEAMFLPLNCEAVAPYHAYNSLRPHAYSKQDMEQQEENQTNTCSTGDESYWTDYSSVQSGEDIVVQQLPHGASADYIVEPTATNSCHLYVAPEAAAAAANSYPPQIATIANSYPNQIAPEARPSEEAKSRPMGKRNKRVPEECERTEIYSWYRDKNNEESNRCKLRQKEQEERKRKQLLLLKEVRDKLKKEECIEIEYIKELESKLKEKKEYISDLRKSSAQDVEDEDQTDTRSTGAESLWTDCSSVQSGEDIVVQQLPYGASANYVIEATATNSCHLHVAPEAAAANNYPPQTAPEAAAESSYPPQIAPEAAVAISYPPQIAPEAAAESNYPPQIAPDAATESNYPPQIAPEEAVANSYPPQIAPEAAVESSYPPQMAPEAAANRSKYYLQPGVPTVPKAKTTA